MKVTVTDIDSSAVAAWRWNSSEEHGYEAPALSTLDIEYRNGGTYRYYAVSMAAVETLLDPETSVGQYVATCVKPRHAVSALGNYVLTSPKV
jgi:hypothetical protein